MSSRRADLRGTDITKEELGRVEEILDPCHCGEAWSARGLAQETCHFCACALEALDWIRRAVKAEARASNFEELVKMHERLHEGAIKDRDAARGRVRVLEGLCAEVVRIEPRLSIWSWKQLQAAMRGEPIDGTSVFDVLEADVGPLAPEGDARKEGK